MTEHTLRLRLEPVHVWGGGLPRAYGVRDERGNDRGVVRRRSRRVMPYALTAKGLHTLFPVVVFPGNRCERVYLSPSRAFQTLAEVRVFIADEPWKHWKEN